MPETINFTERSLLGGNLIFRQPKNGYRTAIEPIFLAAGCEAKPEQRVLDVGCGVGTAALCLAKRIPGVCMVGVDIQGELIELAKQNGAINSLDIDFIVGDISLLSPKVLPRGYFHHVMTNPPFYTSYEATPSPYESKHLGHIETSTPLKEWIELCGKFLRSKGVLTIIYTAGRCSELMHALVDCGFGAISVFPLWPRQGKMAKRVLVRAVKCRRLTTDFLPGLILHNNEGYTKQAHDILNGTTKLNWCETV